MPVVSSFLQVARLRECALPGDLDASRYNATVEHDRTLAQIARGLTWIGGAFLVAGAAVIVWAVFRTVGVDDLLVALTVAGLGLGLPAIVAFVVAWILISLGHPDAEPEAGEPISAAVDISRPHAQTAPLAWGYVVAVLACIIAWALRTALDPLLGQQVIYAPLLLSVAFAAWYGGLGPALLATLLGAVISWYAYLSPGHRFGPLDVDDAVQLGLYCAAAMCIGGIASALRASRARAEALALEVMAKGAGLESTHAELAAERDRFRITLQAIADAVVATDAQGNVTFVNECAVKLTGWPATEAAGKPLAKVLRTLDERTRRSVTVALDRGPKDDAGTMILVARDGSERLIEPKVSTIRDRGGATGGFVLVFRDTTEARHARAALEESEARFRVMADQTPVLLWMSDAKRRGVYFNRSWLEFTGRTAEQEAGDGWAAGVHPEDFGPWQAAYVEAFDARTPFTREYRLRRHDGEYRWILDHGAPRFDGDGDFAGYIGACLDITQRKDAEASIGAFTQRKSAFLASLAHELRNPLAPIRSSIELLQRLPASADPRVARAQDIIERQCTRLAVLVDDLLDLSRIDSGNVSLRHERVDVAQVIDRAAARHAAMLRDRRQTLTVDVPRNRLRVIGDPDRLEQLFGILIGNASKFTPPAGSLRIAARLIGDSVEIDVADSGAGIDPAMQPLLFDLFDHAGDAGRNAPHGLGTGLAIVARLVRLHGGSISTQSAGAGRGSTFTLRFASADSAAESHSPASDADESQAKRALRVLVVDDNVDAADAIGTLLAMSGFEVVTAHDSADAIERAAAFDPDVILLDIGLPGKTGYELAREMRAHPSVSRAKLIALTGYGQPGDTEQADVAGFAGYLVKPVDGERLRERIEAVTRGEDADIAGVER